MSFSRTTKLLGGALLLTTAVSLTLMTTIGCAATPLTQQSSQDTIDVDPAAALWSPRQVVTTHQKKGHNMASSSNDIGTALGERSNSFARKQAPSARGAAPSISSPLAATVTTAIPPVTSATAAGAAHRRIDSTPSPAIQRQHKSNKLMPECPRCAAKAAAAAAAAESSGERTRLTEEEFRYMRIEEIKTQILRKLRMSSRPNTTIPRSLLPAPIVRGGFTMPAIAARNNRDIDDFYGKTEQVIVMAEQADYPTCNTDHHDPAACFFFNLSDDVIGASRERISSAEMWAFKLRDPRDSHNQTYHVTEIVRDSTGATQQVRVVSIRETSVKDGWIKFDILTTIRRWHSGGKEHGLEISCKTCAMDLDSSPVSNDPGERPFIVVHLNTQPTLRRNRRSPLNCTNTTTQCCRDELFVSFADVGWSDWIIEPAGYMANICRGSCIEIVPNHIHRHTTVIQLIIQNKLNLTVAQQTSIAPCCAPTRMSSINLLYQDNSGQILLNIMPNMVVDSCACL